MNGDAQAGIRAASLDPTAEMGGYLNPLAGEPDGELTEGELERPVRQVDFLRRYETRSLAWHL
ncbi:MAG TPA: hypothetical protein VNM43_12015 [Dehalococcoidia bacterium]|nr:hypothetical protein [Dehalococcoidia bacterium]